jgi:hypothetical protein
MQYNISIVHVCIIPTSIQCLILLHIFLIMLTLQFVPVDVELACKIKNLIISLSQYIMTLNYSKHRNKVN